MSTAVLIMLLLLHSDQTISTMNKLQSARNTYNKLLIQEKNIECYFKNPTKNVISAVTVSLAHYNRMLNYIIIKIKIKDRMYIRSVLRLHHQKGPSFLKYNYSFSELSDMYGCTCQDIVNLQTWYTDTHFLWFLFKRSVKKYKYIQL